MTDVTLGDLARLGVRLRYVRVPAEAGWMFEGLERTARKARHAALRKILNNRNNRNKGTES